MDVTDKEQQTGSSVRQSRRLSAKRAPLTSTNLRQLTREMAPKRKQSTEASPETTLSNTNSETTTTKGFGRQLDKNGVSDSDFVVPSDLAAITESLKKELTLDSPTPDLKKFLYYKQTLRFAHTEMKTQCRIWTNLANDCYHEGEDYTDYHNHSWTLLDNLTTNGISSAKPDIVEAFRAKSYPPDLGDVLPGMFPASPEWAMPSLAVEFKEAKIGLPRADLQCAYDGALMVRGAMEAYIYMYGEDTLDQFWDKTKAITIAFNGDHLKISAHFAKPNPARQYRGDHKILFYQYAIVDRIIASDYDVFLDGLKFIRNAQEKGYELACDLRRQLWEHYTEEEAARATTPETPLTEDNVAMNVPPSPASEGSTPPPKAPENASRKTRGPTRKKARVDK